MPSADPRAHRAPTEQTARWRSRERLTSHIDEMYGFIEQLVAGKGRDDDAILAALIAAEEDGDSLPHEDLLGQIITLYVAGHEPTAGLVGNGMLALLRQPDQGTLLQSNP